MDRDRLKDIQTADLSDSQVNEDFVQWLKTKGPSYLLIIMIVIVGYMFFIKYQNSKTAHRAEAWIAYLEAVSSGLPASHEDVAQTYADIDSLGQLGLLSAADGYMRAILSGQTIGSNAEFGTTLLEEDRIFYLEKADGLYARVIANDTGSKSESIIVISALNGRAAIAESSGDVEQAIYYYELAMHRSSEFPALAAQAALRVASIDGLSEVVSLPTDAQVAARNTQAEERNPATVDPAIGALTDISVPEIED